MAATTIAAAWASWSVAEWREAGSSCPIDGRPVGMTRHDASGRLQPGICIASGGFDTSENELPCRFFRGGSSSKTQRVCCNFPRNGSEVYERRIPDAFERAFEG